MLRLPNAPDSECSTQKGAVSDRSLNLLHHPNVQCVLIVVHCGEAEFERIVRNGEPESCAASTWLHLILSDKLAGLRKLHQRVLCSAREHCVAVSSDQVTVGRER